MNLEEAILYAHQRMREIGKQPNDYHFEPVKVTPNEYEEIAGKFEINAYNEIYILINPETYFGVFIIADNSAFNSDVPLECGAPEFTGKIIFKRINDLNGWSYPPLPGEEDNGKRGVATGNEFLRVVY